MVFTETDSCFVAFCSI